MKRQLYIISAVITIASILLSVGLVIFTSLDVQVAVVVSFTPLILSLGFAAYSTIRLELADVDSRRFGSLPLQQLTTLPDLESSIVSIVRDTAAIKRTRGPFMRSLAAEQARHAVRSISDIADGGHICASEDELRLVRMAVAHTDRRIRAVAARGAKWSERPEADAYWHAYEVAADRLDITRVFIVGPDEDTVALERVLERNANAGIKTIAIDAERIPEHHIRPLVIFDENLVHSHPYRDEPGGTFTVEFSDRPADLLQAEETFRVVLDLANEAGEVILGSHPSVRERAFKVPRRWRRWTAALRRSTR